MTEAQAFSEFHEALLLDPKEVRFAREFPDEVRAAITGAGYTVQYSELQGSLKKATALSPLKDVDMFVSLDPLNWGGHPNDGFLSAKDVASRIVDALWDHIPSVVSIERKPHALCLNLGVDTPQFDLVLAFEVDDGSGDIEIMDLDRPLVWQRSWPRADRDAVAAANKATEGRLVHAVRQIKHATKANLHEGFPGLAVEGLGCRSTSADHAYATICLAILERGATEMGGVVMEPAERADISGKITELGVNAKSWFEQRAATARAARQAGANGHDTDAIDLWHQVFGDPFPKSGRQSGSGERLMSAAAALSFGGRRTKATRAYGDQ